MTNINEFFKHKSPLSFHDYMQAVLYEPGLGYYSAKDRVLGRQADFVTAPELTPLFAHSIAQQILGSSWANNPCSILEFGAGNGRLCVDLLKYLSQHGLDIEQYYILDLSPVLKQKQYDLILQEAPNLLNKVQWLQALPSEFSGVVLANEVLDAMPVHRFLWTGEDVLESFIFCDEGLNERFVSSQNQALITAVSALDLSEAPYCSEINLWLKPWLSALFDSLSCALVLLIDYGYSAAEYYHPDRREGSIMCHHQQKASTDFLAAPFEMDLTAHVNFTAVAEQAYDLGFSVLGYTNQASFLLGNGILDLLATIQDAKEYMRQAQALKILLQPQEMGDLFKVMALSKNFDEALQGFQFKDLRVSL